MNHEVKEHLEHHQEHTEWKANELHHNVEHVHGGRLWLFEQLEVVDLLSLLLLGVFHGVLLVSNLLGLLSTGFGSYLLTRNLVLYGMHDRLRPLLCDRFVCFLVLFGTLLRDF